MTTINQPESDKLTCPDCGGLYHGAYEICPKRQQPDTELRLTVTCGNCYQEAEVGLFTIGKDVNDFYKRHRTRIGRTFCSLDAICVRYNPIATECQAAEQRGRKKELIRLKHAAVSDTVVTFVERHVAKRLATLRSTNRKDAE